MASNLRATVGSLMSFDREAVVVFLLDGSGSVGKALFDGPLKSAVLKLGKLVPKSFKVVVQFATDVKRECMPTKEYSIFEKAVNDMVFLDQGTDTNKGLNDVWEILITDQMKPLKKLVIVITDGCSSTKTKESVKNLKAINADILCIGVGNGISYKRLKEMSSDKQLAINLDDYSLLFKALQSLEVSGGKIEPKVMVELAPKSSSMRHDEPLSLLVSVKNVSGETIPEGAVVFFPKSSYFYPTEVDITQPIKRYGRWKGEVELELLGGRMIEEFPTDLEWECKSEDTVYCKGTTSLGTGFLRGDFYYNKAPINVLMFGRKGSGKSSLINTFQNTLIVGHKVMPSIAAVAESPDHVTTAYTAYPLRCHLRNNRGVPEEGANQIPFVFYDLWGDSEQDFKGISITHFMKGCIPVGTKKVEDVIQIDGYEGKPERGREIHAVVFVVTLAARNFPDKIARIKKTIQKVTDMNMNPLVVVTMCDHFDADELEDAKSEMKTVLKVNRMYFLTNYSEQAARDPKGIDFPARAVLADIFAEGLKTHNSKTVNDPRYFHKVNFMDFSEVQSSEPVVNTTPPTTPKRVGGKPKKSPKVGKKPGKSPKVGGPPIVFNVTVGDETTKHRLSRAATVSDLIVRAIQCRTSEACNYVVLNTNDYDMEFSNNDTLKEVGQKMEKPYCVSIYDADD